MHFLDIFQKVPVYVLLMLSAAGVISGDFFAKYWSTNTRPVFWVLAMVGYVCSGFFYIPVLLRDGLVVTATIWSLAGIIGFLIIGLVIFKEHLNLAQIAGVGLGVIALIILSFSGK